MKLMTPAPIALCLLAATLSILVGCGSEGSMVSVLRKDLILDQEPSETTTIAAATESIATDSSVTIVADVVGDDAKAFVKGQAAFIVTEVGEGEKCTDVDCPFCDDCKGNKSRNATVQFVDESGNPIAIDTRDLLGINAGDTVVIQGKGEILEGLDMLQITASNIFIRSKAKANQP